MISSHIDRRPLNLIRSKLCRDRLCDTSKYHIVEQNIDILYHDETCDLYPLVYNENNY